MPTITEINPQIGDVVEYRSSGYTQTYTMDHNGLKAASGIYLSSTHFNGVNEGVDNFYLVSRASDTEQVGRPYELNLKVGDKLECVEWLGDTYKKGDNKTITHNYEACSGAGIWKVVSRASDKVRTLVVGQTYKGNNGHQWEAIYSNGEHVWMKGAGISAAYVWTIEGKAVSLGHDGTWDVDFSPILALETVQIRNVDNMVIGEGEVTTKDGKPDWDTLEVKAKYD